MKPAFSRARTACRWFTPGSFGMLKERFRLRVSLLPWQSPWRHPSTLDSDLKCSQALSARWSLATNSLEGWTADRDSFFGFVKHNGIFHTYSFDNSDVDGLAF